MSESKQRAHQVFDGLTVLTSLAEVLVEADKQKKEQITLLLYLRN